MPSFFTFQQGTESRARPSAQDASPLLGRFRAVPGARRGSLLGSTREGILKSIGGSVGYGYGTLFGLPRGEEALAGGDDVEGGAAGGGGDVGCWGEGGVVGSFADVWIRPRQGAVRRVVERWWRRWGVLVVLPAAIVSSFFFCAEGRLVGGLRVRGEARKELTGPYRWWFGVRFRSLSTRFQRTMIPVDLRMRVLGTDIGPLDMEMRGCR
jgi:hypothetical protein